MKINKGSHSINFKFIFVYLSIFSKIIILFVLQVPTPEMLQKKIEMCGKLLRVLDITERGLTKTRGQFKNFQIQILTLGFKFKRFFTTDTTPAANT